MKMTKCTEKGCFTERLPWNQRARKVSIEDNVSGVDDDAARFLMTVTTLKTTCYTVIHDL